MRRLLIPALLLLTCSACDGLDAFERTNPRDPAGSNFAPNVGSNIQLVLNRNEVSVRWTESSSREDGFLVERRRNGGTYQRVARVGANDTTATDTVRALGTYTYRVCSLLGDETADCETGTVDLSLYLRLPDIPEEQDRSTRWRSVNLDSSSVLSISLRGRTRRFDFQTWTWTRTASLSSITRVDKAVRLSDGRVLALGEDEADCDTGFGAVFTPSTNEWGPVHCMKTEGGDTDVRDAVALEGGGALVVGDTGDWEPFANVFRGAQFRSVSAPAQDGQLTLLPDGRVLSTGRTSALFDPTTESWTPADIPSIGVGRLHTAMLGDGRVLIVESDLGGAERAWTYDPSANTSARQPDPPVSFTTVLAFLSQNRVFAGINLRVGERSRKNPCLQSYVYHPYIFDGERGEWQKGTSTKVCVDPSVRFPLAVSNRTPVGEGTVLVTSGEAASLVSGRN